MASMTVHENQMKTGTPCPCRRSTSSRRFSSTLATARSGTLRGIVLDIRIFRTTNGSLLPHLRLGLDAIIGDAEDGAAQCKGE